MGVSCQILMNNPKGGYWPGQTINGVVKYALEQPLKVSSVVLSLIGKGNCKWTETRSVNKTIETVSCKGQEEYVTTSIHVIEKNSDEEVTIPEGCYEFPFDFMLPRNVPPSFKDDIGSISYILCLKFERPGIFRFDKKFTAAVPVRSCLEGEAEGPLVFGLDKTLTKPFSKRNHVITLKVNIEKTFLTPEEKVTLNLVVTNDTSVTITTIKSALMRYITYTSDRGKTKVSETILKESTVKSSSIPNNTIVNLRQEISTLPDMISINSKVIKVEFRLKVTVRLPMPHLNASVEIPIVIGEKLEERTEEDPPSYWELMSEAEKVTE